MAAPPPTWLFTACLTYCGGAENVLPGWGQGGVRLSFFLRLRLAVNSQCGRAPAPAERGKKPPRGLKLLRFLRNRLAGAAPRVPSLLRRKKPPPPPLAAVTSQCGRPPVPAEPGKRPPRALKLLRLLRSRLARAPRLPSLLRRKKPPPPPRAAVAKSAPRAVAIPSLLKNQALMRPAMVTALCFLAGFAVAAAFIAGLRFMAGLMIPNTSCVSWRCFLAKKFLQFLGPPLFEWLSKVSLKLIKFLDPPALCEWLGLPKLSLKWLFNK